MEKKNKHMTLEERIEIQECLDKGMTFKAIGQRIGKDQHNNNITTYDLTTRIEYLRNQIFSARAKRSIGDKTALSSDTIISMYGEYTLALQLLTDVYIDTFYLQSKGNVTVFILHSSVANELALMVASDLKRAKYNVWSEWR